MIQFLDLDEAQTMKGNVVNEALQTLYCSQFSFSYFFPSRPSSLPLFVLKVHVLRDGTRRVVFVYN